MIDSPRLRRRFEKPPHPAVATLIFDRFRYRRHLPGGCLPSVKNADGETLCRWCRGSVGKGRRKWCGDWCTDSYWVRASGSAAAARAIARDDGRCRTCRYPGNDVERVYRHLFSRANAQRRYLLGSHDRHLGPSIRAAAQLEALRRWSARRGIELTSAGWQSTEMVTVIEVDHIVPVVDGGGSCGLANLQTLCVRCHRAETKALAARRAARRRAATRAANFLLALVLTVGDKHKNTRTRAA